MDEHPEDEPVSRWWLFDDGLKMVGFILLMGCSLLAMISVAQLGGGERKFFPFGRTGDEGNICYAFGACNGGHRCEIVDTDGTPRSRGIDEEDPTKRCVAAGGAFRLCARGGACEAGLSCVGDRCIPVGGEDEPCRPDGACAPGLSCFTGTDARGADYRRCAAMARAASVAVGGRSLCFLTVDGRAKCLDLMADEDPRGSETYPSPRAPFCAAHDAGKVVCGREPMTRKQVFPREVEGLGAGVRSLSAGRAHACAVTSVGAAKCWGDNAKGQLGDGTTEFRTTPVGVKGLDGGVRAIAAGVAHTCALMEEGGVKCWGDNQFGQLGDGTTAVRPAPVEAKLPGGGARAIAAGWSLTCALSSAGPVFCWGSLVEKLPSGDVEPRSFTVPTQIAALGSDVIAISAGNDLCAVHADGRPQCVGVPHGSDIESFLDGCERCGVGWGEHCIVAADGKKRELLGEPVGEVTAGGGNACAITSAGRVVCWGPAFSGGRCRTAHYYYERRYPPVDILGTAAPVVKDVAAGGDLVCVVTGEGAVLCLDAGKCRSQSVGEAETGIGAETYRVDGETAWDTHRMTCPPPAPVPGTGP